MDAAQRITHLSEPDLLRHIDREGDQAEQTRRDTHLRGCPACAERLVAIRRQSGAVSAWLARTDPADTRPDAVAPVRTELPRPRRALAAGSRATTAATPWLRAAAIILLLAAPLAALPPVRQWITERVRATGVESAPATVAGELETADPPVIRFSPAPGTFTIRVEGAAAAGTLALARSEGPDAVLRSAGAAAPPVVADDVLRLTAAPPPADPRYELRVPPSVEAVRLVLERGTVLVPAAALDAGTTLALSARP